MFRRFDVNKDGTLSHQEFRDGIIAAGSARISITNSSVRLTVHQICSISHIVATCALYALSKAHALHALFDHPRTEGNVRYSIFVESISYFCPEG